MYSSIKELINEANEHNTPLWKIILETEMQISGISEEKIIEKLASRYDVMYRSTQKALDKPQQTAGNLITGIASKQYLYSKKFETNK